VLGIGSKLACIFFNSQFDFLSDSFAEFVWNLSQVQKLSRYIDQLSRHVIPLLIPYASSFVFCVLVAAASLFIDCHPQICIV
jgi:hypothetical protein